MDNFSSPKSQTEARIAACILRYLSRNPEARDTLAGIASWWLLSQQIDDAIGEVSGALDFLLAEGLIGQSLHLPMGGTGFDCHVNQLASNSACEAAQKVGHNSVQRHL